MGLSSLTGRCNYFEDFSPGMRLRHIRGKTIGETENVLITNMVMNSAQAHFNEHFMRSMPIKARISYGGVNFSLVVGLASQDTSENAIAELALDNIKLKAPVVHGDTLYASTEVLEVRDADRPDAGIVRFRHYGTNQHEKLVCELERTVLLKRRSHWGEN